MAQRMTENRRKFAEWLATSRYDRQPGSQTEFAAMYGVNEVTLSKWKKQLTDEVNEIAKEKMREGLPEVLGSILREAVKGSYQHAKLYLEVVGELAPEGNAVTVVVKYADDYNRTNAAS